MKKRCTGIQLTLDIRPQEGEKKKQQKPFDKLSNGISVIVRTSGEKWETHKERQIPKGNTIPHLDVPIKQPDLLLSCSPSGSRIKVLYESRHVK